MLPTKDRFKLSTIRAREKVISIPSGFGVQLTTSLASELDAGFGVGHNNNDEDEDDEDDWKPPHDPTSEKLPRLPIYHPAFKLTEKITHKTLKVFETFIKHSGYEDDEANHLLAEVRAHSRIPYGDAVRIGLIGDAGVGKSSTINSLLGVANLTVEVSLADSYALQIIHD